MKESQKPNLNIEDINKWLRAYYNTEPVDLKALSGGFWSSAYVYRIDSEEFVLRLSDSPTGFDIDAAAMTFVRVSLPIPKILDQGKALGLNFVISCKHSGEFIETRPLKDADSIGKALDTLLTTMRSVPNSNEDPVIWFDPAKSIGFTWRDWLKQGLVDHKKVFHDGIDMSKTSEKRLKALFAKCCSTIDFLLPACPERRDLVHGDLLHQNVLVSDDCSKVTAIFSWKCSVKGDFLFDVSWCTFWGRGWHPTIEASNIDKRTLRASDLNESDLLDAALRHHCYELQIAASHILWYLWTKDINSLTKLLQLIDETIQRGPHLNS